MSAASSDIKESKVSTAVEPGPNGTAISGSDKLSPHEKKIKRIQLSCTSCRHRKLKCNRLQPCENCVKRGQAHSCFYANPGPRKTPAQVRLSAKNNELQQRLMHLEELVISLQSRNDGSPDPAIAAALHAKENPSAVRTGTMDGDDDYPGRMVTDKTGTRYVDSAHWQAMLDEIDQVKEHLCGVDEDEDGQDINRLAKDPGAPLLLGSIGAASKADLLGGIPSKPILDQLIKTWFSAREPALICIHVPTFMIEYEQFWKNPRNASPAYLAMLYSIVWLGTAYYLRMGQEFPTDRPADPASLMDFYVTKAAQALILSDYTKPGRYKLDALVLYFSAEFLRFRDANAGLSFLISITVRLAMLSGYHRDPKHFPSLTPYESEMRRRTWTLVLQLDTLVAFQVGLPRVIHDWQCDTGQPRNLYDEDLHVDCERIPPARPESDRTPVTYQITKGRLMAIFGTVSDRAYSKERMTYDEIMLLDMRLREAYDGLPQFLKIRSLSQCLQDPRDLVMQRYNLVFLYNKVRLILHRRAFSGALNDARCLYSKRICVESALEVLRKQKEIHDASHDGGIFQNDRWYLSSLTTHDFIMAAMVLCLWLSREQEQIQNNSDGSDSPTSQHLGSPLETLRSQPNSGELFKVLEDSYKIWLAMKNHSYEAYKASKALAVMLGKTRARAEKPVKPISDHLSRGINSLDMQEPGARKPAQKAAAISASSSTTAGGTASRNGSQISTSPPTTNDESPGSDQLLDETLDYDMLPDFNDIEFANVTDAIMDAPLDLDWKTWDMQYTGVGAGMQWTSDPTLQTWSAGSDNTYAFPQQQNF